MGSRRWVMHLTRNTGFHLTSPEIWLNSPKGPSSAVQPIGKSSPSNTSSASAGTSRSTVLHFASGTGDGARCDVDGNVWVSSNARGDLGYSGVTVCTPDGKLIGRIRLPESTANLCFGGPKRNRLFVAASQSLYAVYTRTQGAAPG